jgi:hypothetical protein
MRHHRNGGPPGWLPDPNNIEYRAQKMVLIELVVTPPPEGDRVDELVARLPIPDDSIEPALSALQRAGLAVRDGDVARASAPALYFEYLWPVGL